VFSFASIFWSIDTSSSIDISIKIFIIFINIFFIYNIAKYFALEYYILYGILLGAFYNYLIALDLVYYSSQYTEHFIHRFVGTSNNPNVLAIYMLFSINASIFLLQKFSNIIIKIILFSNIGLAIYSIILSASKKGALFASLLLVAYILLSLTSKKTFIWSVLSSIGLYYVFQSDFIFKFEIFQSLLHRFDVALSAYTSGATGGSTYERLSLINIAYEVFSQDFGTMLFGTGQNTFSLQNNFGLYAHNNYMEILANLGLIGLGLFYAMHSSLFIKMNLLNNKKMKYLFITLLVILLLMDNAMVSYAFKPTLFMFIFISLYIKNNTTKFKDNR